MTYERGAVLYRLISELFRGRGIWPLRLTGSNSVAAMVELAADGVGICAIPAPVVAPYIASGRLRILRTEVLLPDAEFFVTHWTQPFNDLAAAVADAALAICQEHIAEHPSVSTSRPILGSSPRERH